MSNRYFLFCISFFLANHAVANTQLQLDWRVQSATHEPTLGQSTQRIFDHERGASLLLTSQTDWTDEWSTQLNALAQSDGERRSGISEAYLQWQPLSSSEWRSRVRLGSFFPMTSIENSSRGWLNPWTISFSAINSWLAEEVRNNGLDYTLRFDSQTLEVNYQWELSLSALSHNDVSGAALAWRGFRLSDRISVWNDELVLPTLPSREPTAAFKEQADTLTPFRENDDKWGYQLRWSWFRAETQIHLSHWQNNATPTQLIDGQYGWDTAFDQFSWRQFITFDFFVGAQYLRGSSLMGKGAFTSVDIDFDSAFILLGWQNDHHQYALRVEQFNVEDNDQTPNDDNNQDGKATTVSWRYNWTKSVSTQLEWQYVDSERPARSYSGQPSSQQERLWQFALKWKL